MNALATFAGRETLSAAKLPDLAETVAAANDWVRIARPIIKAYRAIDDVHSEVLAAARQFRGHKRWNERKDYDEQACSDAGDEIAKLVDALDRRIADIRADVLCDHYQHGPGQPEPTDPVLRAGWDQAEDDAEEFNRAVDTAVVSVDAAIAAEVGL